MRWLFPLFVSLWLASCATVFKDRRHHVKVTSDQPGTPIMVNGEPAGETPETITVDSSLTYIISLKPKSGPLKTCTLVPSISAGWVILDVLFPVGLPIDILTGEWYSHDVTRCHAFDYVNPPAP